MMNFVTTIFTADDKVHVYESFSVSHEAALHDALKRLLKTRQPLTFLVREWDADPTLPDESPIDDLEELRAGEPLDGDIIAPIKRWHPAMPVYVTLLQNITVQVVPKHDHRVY